MKKEFLYTPGPVNVPPDVLMKMSEPVYHHRTPRFRDMYAKVLEKLAHVFRTENTVISFTSSGTGAMEASFVNFLSPGDHVITINGGKFGERWTQLAEAYGLACHEIPVTWGDAPSPEKVSALLKQHPETKAVFTELTETSTGTVYDIKALGEVVKDTDALFVVDAVSGLGADDIHVDEWHVDVCVAGSQKALMIPPGLSFMSISEKAWAMAETARLPRYYFDLRKCKKSLEKGDTPFTPAHTLLEAVNVSLDMIVEETIERVIARHSRLADAVRAGTAALGLTLYSKSPANALTAVVFADIDAEKLRGCMREDGVYVAGGQNEAKGKIIRIAMMGYAADADVVNVIAALERALKKCGADFIPGAGVKAAQESLLKSYK